MAFQKSDRYQTPIALADDVQRFIADEPTTAYREPWTRRAVRWTRRHRRGLLQASQWPASRRFAGLLWQATERRTCWPSAGAQERLVEFYRLADEAQFFAASTDASSERVPYYEPRRATAAHRGGAIATPWGERAENLPLDKERYEFLQSQYELLLLMCALSWTRIDGPRSHATLWRCSIVPMPCNLRRKATINCGFAV